jgi:class 3 adenylate cyclase
MEKTVRFCTASDGVRIAYATYGSGYPLILVPGWVSHLDIDDFLWDAVVEGLLDATGHSLMIARFDKRGTGLSQRGDVGLSVESRLHDIEAVEDALKLRRFALDGISEGGPIATAYAARYPRRVSHLIVYGSFARGLGDALGDQAAADAMFSLIKSEWGLASSVFTLRLLGGASAEDIRKFAHLQKEGVTADDAIALLRMNFSLDIRDQLPSIKAPTLVIHGRNDEAVPFERGRELAQLIPNARFLAHDGGHYAGGDAAESVLRAVAEFLSDVTVPAHVAPDPPPARTPEAAIKRDVVTIVFTDIERNTEILQRLGDAAWRDLLREHERMTRDLLKQHAGDEIKTIGDAFMASFGSATQALECAIAVQRAFAARNELATEPIHVRIGINSGEPIAEDGDLFGTSVTMASRIASVAAGGEIVASNVVRELVAGKGFLFADRGDSAMRGFEDPVRLYEVRWQD